MHYTTWSFTWRKEEAISDVVVLFVGCAALTVN